MAAPSDNLVDQWYYLVGQETRGPVQSAEIVRLIRAGSLNSSALVAQAGWQTWSPASTALANLLSPPPLPGPSKPGVVPGPVPAPAEPLTYAIKVQCISGPDQGKAYMISLAEVSLGRVSGIGQGDPSVAENHVVLSWQRNVLHFRTFPGSKLRVAGVEVTQGTLSNGQQFQLGSSIWQVGSAPVELTSLLGTLGARLAKLTSTDKLEGFSLTAMFSEVFKGRKAGEVEDYLIVGTPKTTPHIDDVQTGWPKPWFFMRVLIFMAVVYFIFFQMFDISENARIVPGLIIMGSLVVPLATVFLFWELNTPRNVSFHMVLILVCLGGVISLAVSLIAFDVAHLEWLGAASAGICEETGKLLTVILVVRNTKYKYILNGLVFGAAIGGGFGAFETAGYAFNDGFFNSFLTYFLRHSNDEAIEKLVGHALVVGYDGMITLIHRRSYYAPFMHVAWTAISAGALWRVKGANPFRIGMLFDPRFLRTFFVPVLLHMFWNSPLLRFPGALGLIKPILVGGIGWYVVLGLVQEGMRQIREEQLTRTRIEYDKTQQVLTTTGRFRMNLS
jgi:RsiW-degrading membrane proteinase PrsW (M82 family)